MLCYLPLSNFDVSRTYLCSECILVSTDWENRDSEVGIAIGCELEDRGVRVRFPVEDSSLFHGVQTDSEAWPASYLMYTRALFSVVRPECEGHHFKLVPRSERRRRFNVMFTTTHHWPLSSVRWIQSTIPIPFPPESILMFLSFRLCLVLVATKCQIDTCLCDKIVKLKQISQYVVSQTTQSVEPASLCTEVSAEQKVVVWDLLYLGFQQNWRFFTWWLIKAEFPEHHDCRNLGQWVKFKGTILIHVWLNDCLGWRTESPQHASRTV
jgi:hypothetical protein